MPCRQPGCGCGFVSETLTISEVSPGVWQFEQAEFSIITELEEAVAQLQSDVTDLTAALAAQAAAQTAALAAAVLLREPVRHVGTVTQRTNQTALLVTNSVTIPAAANARYVIVDATTFVSRTVAADFSDVRARYNGSNITRVRLGGGSSGTGLSATQTWAGVLPAATVGTFDITVERTSGGTGTYSTTAAGADNRLEVSAFALT